MCDINVLYISKNEVLMEDYSFIYQTINNLSNDINKLISVRNTWEIIFSEYEDDPREIPDIPEIVNWMEKSVEEGIAWFYFLNAESNSTILRLFLIACGANRYAQSNAYIFDEDKFMHFIEKNLRNLEKFAEKYNLPDEVCCEATDAVMEYINSMLDNSPDQSSYDNHKAKMKDEALNRLSVLEKLHGINSNIKRYFNDGKLYYSYVTGGFLGSIDTINYDPRYAKIVEDFENQTGAMVYHVIEHKNTISLLYVSDDCDYWTQEIPERWGTMACVVDLDTYKTKTGYIKLDVLQGALRRVDDRVYDDKPQKKSKINNLTALDNEIIERLEILKEEGLFTDLDIVDMYITEGQICFSKEYSVLGIPTGVILRIDSNDEYNEYAKLISEQTTCNIYFMMVSKDNKLAFLFVPDDDKDWEIEKLFLRDRKPYAIVLDTENMRASIEKISYKIINGGPVCSID